MRSNANILVEAGKSSRYPDAYAFRSAAFQEILRDLDRTVLAEYESYYQQLADLEFRMSESENRLITKRQRTSIRRMPVKSNLVNEPKGPVWRDD